MKYRWMIVLILMLTGMSLLHTQTQTPFEFTVYGGLFFPSNVHFKDIYQSTNDLLWGFGVAVPLEGLLHIAGDVAYFKSEAFLDPANDSVATLEERFLHLGVINKSPLGRDLYLRLSGGFNYISIKQKTSSLLVPEQSIEGDNKIGYFGGVGIEELLEGGHTALFADILYDYRRSRQKELAGDFGGLRVVLGLHVILF
ncbi:MAG: hypothetical protein HYR76_04930 [Ignavibacteria bacterium]|nr:hypothetical protein [Ignavibacteria bacterium]